MRPAILMLRRKRDLPDMLRFTILIGTILLTSLSGAGSQPVILITPEEASAPAPASKSFEIDRPVAPGPIVEVITPQNGKEYKSPLPVEVRFLPRDGKEIDLSSFKVELLKLFTIDITYRFLPYASKEGVTMPEAEVPPGKHMIKLSVADITGAATSVLMVVAVK